MGFFKTIGNIIDVVVNREEYKDKGSTGERFTYRILDDIFHKKYILRNVYLKKADGKYTEIDILIVSTKGIFVFESKNYSGWIYGDEANSNWTQTLSNGYKNSFFNPIIQNNVHIKSLKHNLPQYPTLQFFSIIVFSDSCELKKINITSKDVYVTQRQHLKNTVVKIYSSTNDVINENDCNNIASFLSSFSRPDDTIKKQHLDDVENSLSTCPRCNSALQARTNKSNGEVFYGCSNYPKCKYTVKEINHVN